MVTNCLDKQLIRTDTDAPRLFRFICDCNTCCIFLTFVYLRGKQSEKIQGSVDLEHLRISSCLLSLCVRPSASPHRHPATPGRRTFMVLPCGETCQPFPEEKKAIEALYTKKSFYFAQSSFLVDMRLGHSAVINSRGAVQTRKKKKKKKEREWERERDRLKPGCEHDP